MPNYRQGKRRKMTKFELGEISFVDNPAQEPALARLQKMSDEELGQLVKIKPKRNESQDDFVARFMESDDMKDSPRNQRIAAARTMFQRANTEKRGDLATMLTGSESGHQHGVNIYGDGDGLSFMVHFAAAEDGEMHDHQIVRTMDGRYVMSENRGHTHDIDQDALMQMVIAAMSKAQDEKSAWNNVPLVLEGVAVADLPELKKATKPSEDDMPDNAEKKLQDQIAALTAKNEELAKIAALTGAHKAHFDKMDDELEEDARKEFLDASAEKRDEIVAQAAAKSDEADPVVYTAVNGDVYRKSDDARLVKMAKERDEERKESIRLRKSAEDADLTKRAETDLDKFPGDVDVRKAILKAVDGIEDEGVRQKAHDALKSHSESFDGALKTIGTEGQPVVAKSSDKNAAADELDRLAKEHAKEKGIDFFDAYDKVAEANPELLAKAVNG